MKKANYIFCGIIFAIAIFFIAIALNYPKASAYGTGVPGPGLWPICVSIVMLFCVLLLFIKQIKAKKDKDVEDEKIELWNKNTKRVYICMVILALYVAVLKYLGFIVATIPMLFIFIYWFAKKKWYITLLISVIVTLVVYYVFRYVLNVSIGFGLIAF